MNEQDEKLLELYLKDVKKKKIFFLIIVIIFIVIFTLYGFYTKYKQSSKVIEMPIYEETETNIINGNNSNEEIILKNENSAIKETENQNIISQDTNENINKNANNEKPKQKTKETSKEKTQITTSNKSIEESSKEKPVNKDFLFTDGYTMDNVTQAAQEYLNAYDYSGECVPIKDDEGICLGMRVIFY